MKRIQIWLAVDTDGSVITSVFADSSSPQPHPNLRALAEADVRQAFEDEDDCEEVVARTMRDMCAVLLTVEAETEEQLARGLVAGHPELFVHGFAQVKAAQQLVDDMAVDVPEPPREQVPDPVAEVLVLLMQRARKLYAGGFHGHAKELVCAVSAVVEWDFHRKGPARDDCVACGKNVDCSPQGATGYPLCLHCTKQAVIELTELEVAPRPADEVIAHCPECTRSVRASERGLPTCPGCGVA